MCSESHSFSTPEENENCTAIFMSINICTLPLRKLFTSKCRKPGNTVIELFLEWQSFSHVSEDSLYFGLNI
jgi:hypothetical protein